MAARTKKATSSRLALLGLFALVAFILLGLGLYYVSNAGPGRGNYRMGVHFATASGIASGAQVYLSGVNIGTVSKVSILPDNSIEIILAIRNNTDIPKGSKFSIQGSVTGSSSIAITPPRRYIAPGSPAPLPRSEVWAKRILPIAEQPVGTAPLTIEQVMGEGQALTKRMKGIFAQLDAHKKPLLGALQSSRSNAFALKDEMSSVLPQLQAQMAGTMRKAQANIADAQRILRTHDQRDLAGLVASMQTTARSAQETQAALRSAMRDPALRRNVRAAAAQMQIAMTNLHALSGDLQSITENPQTRAQLRDAGAHFKAVLEKLKSLL